MQSRPAREGRVRDGTGGPLKPSFGLSRAVLAALNRDPDRISRIGPKFPQLNTVPEAVETFFEVFRSSEAVRIARGFCNPSTVSELKNCVLISPHLESSPSSCASPKTSW